MPDFSNAIDAKYIDVSGNRFQGAISGALLSLPSLEYLYMNNNKLSGNIPQNWGNSQSLLDLYLNDNLLSGAIPPFNGALPIIRKLFFFLCVECLL